MTPDRAGREHAGCRESPHRRRSTPYAPGWRAAAGRTRTCVEHHHSTLPHPRQTATMPERAQVDRPPDQARTAVAEGRYPFHCRALDRYSSAPLSPRQCCAAEARVAAEDGKPRNCRGLRQLWRSIRGMVGADARAARCAHGPDLRAARCAHETICARMGA